MTLLLSYYTEMIFPEADVRFIAINNGVDSASQQDSDFTPFLNIINEAIIDKETFAIVQRIQITYNAIGAVEIPNEKDTVEIPNEKEAA